MLGTIVETLGPGLQLEPIWHGRDYSRNLRTWSPTRAKDCSGYFITRFPTQASIQGGETRDYLRPHHGLGESYSRLVPGLSSKSSEMEKSRRVSSSEHPSGSMERSDYRRHLDEDSERQFQKLSQFSEGFSQIRLPSSKFLWKHLLDEPKRMNGNANHSSKIFPDYGVNISSTRVNAERNYQGSVFAEVSRSGMRMEKPMAMHVERDRTFSGYPLESGTKRSSVDIDGSGLLLPSQKLNISLHKDEGLQSQDPLPADKLSARELYKQEDITKIYSREEKHPFYSSDTSHCVLPSSQSEASTTVPFGSSMDDFRHSCGDFPVRSDGLNISSGTLTEPITHEAYTRISHLNSSRDLTVWLAEATNFRQVQYSSPNDGTHGDYSYPEVRSEKSEVAAPTDKLYGKQASVQDDYGCRDILGPRIVEPITDRIVVTESSRREHLIEGRLWDHHYSAQEQPISNYLDAARSSYASKKDGECLDHRSIDDRYERELYPRHENIYLREDHVYGRDVDLQFDEERLHMLLTREYDPGLNGVDDNHQEGFSMEDLDEQPISNYLDAAGSSYASMKDGECLDNRSIDDEYEREVYPGHENIYLREDHVYGRDAGLQSDEERLHMLFTREYDPGLDGVDDNHQEGFSMEDLDLLQSKRKLDVKKILSKQNLRSKLINNRKFSGQIHDGMSNKPLFNAAQFRNIRTSNEMIGHSNPNSIASGRPSVCNPRHLKSRVSDIKKRLGPQPPVKKYKQHKILRGNEDGHNESTHSEEEAPLKGNHSLVKSGPSEKSEDFKQLVQRCIFQVCQTFA
ncbi:uncharacterized protein LOC130767523 [Actinidia eriantha]|uniref:uncharacterized protein LOC130767523 n=1 Tax=Actinidia eriantha TaxID=165200 RepID=UPI00258DCBDE|nr:uncharacterized protein LOC130767523 [Actinidia eriantha]